MTRQDWLMMLRHCTQRATLERIIEKKNYELSCADLAVFWGAADHRLAELITGRLYDRIPVGVWQFVR